MTNDVTPFSPASPAVTPSAPVAPNTGAMPTQHRYDWLSDSRPSAPATQKDQASYAANVLVNELGGTYQQHRANLLTALPTWPGKVQQLLHHSDILQDPCSLVAFCTLATPPSGPVDQAKVNEVVQAYTRATPFMIDRAIDELRKEVAPRLREAIDWLRTDKESRTFLFSISRVLVPSIRERAGLTGGQIQQRESEAAAARSAAQLPSEGTQALDDEIEKIQRIMRTDRKLYNDKYAERYRALIARRGY